MQATDVPHTDSHCRFLYSVIGKDGQVVDPAKNAAGMAHLGFTGAKRLMGLYQNLIAEGAAILEVGPYLNPLAEPLAATHPWVVWEYDTPAAISLLQRQPNTLLFQADLNGFSRTTWESFLATNRRQLESRGHREAFGAVILSSVLNYFDYTEGLKQIIPQIREDGLLIISNSNMGDGAFMREGQIPPPGTEILETLVREFPTQLSILDGSYTDNGPGGVDRIQLAAKLHWGRTANPQDLYAMGIGFMADQLIRDVVGVLHIDSHTYVRFDASDYRHRLDPSRSDPVAVERWRNVRKVLIDMTLEKRHRELWRISRCESGSEEARKITEQVSQIFNFTPERKILLDALAIRDVHERIEFLNLELGTFFRKMGHAMPDIDGPYPEPAYPNPWEDPRFAKILDMYRELSRPKS